VITRASLPGDWIAVLGGAYRHTSRQVVAAYETGLAIASFGKNVITGATTGLPYAAALGAKEKGALVIGISPGANVEDHVQIFSKPLDAMDAIVYSGLNYEGRGPLIVRSAIGCIFIGGEFGTLNEFTLAWVAGKKVIGILTNLGGMTDSIQDLLKVNKSNYGSRVIFNDDPHQLVTEVVAGISDLSPELNSTADGFGADVREIIEFYRSEQDEG